MLFVEYLVLLNVSCFLSLGVCLCIVSLCCRCDGCCAFCLICHACSFRYSRRGSIFISSCSCCVFVSCVHHVAVLNVVFYVV